MTAKAVGRAARPAPPRTRPATDDDPPCTWWCHNCGAVFKAWAPAERHSDTRGHRRLVLRVDR